MVGDDEGVGSVLARDPDPDFPCSARGLAAVFGPFVPGAKPGPERAPNGLVLRAEGVAFRIDVADRDGRALLSLGPYPEEDVVAIWRALAAASGLPLVIAGPEGALDQPFPQLGRLRIGRACGRRRLAVLNGRRPRFLVKRKLGRLPRRPRVHRESEIARGRGA